jgi:hypothetical protein
MRWLLEIRALCVTCCNGPPRNGTFPHALAFHVQGRGDAQRCVGLFQIAPARGASGGWHDQLLA